jgi:hypothetical protein
MLFGFIVSKRLQIKMGLKGSEMVKSVHTNGDGNDQERLGAFCT